MKAFIAGEAGASDVLLSADRHGQTFERVPHAAMPQRAQRFRCVVHQRIIITYYLLLTKNLRDEVLSVIYGEPGRLEIRRGKSRTRQVRPEYEINWVSSPIPALPNL